MDSLQKTYLFYDLETTSLSPYFGQILQFAAIRTDLELNELERHHIQRHIDEERKRIDITAEELQLLSKLETYIHSAHRYPSALALEALF